MSASKILIGNHIVYEEIQPAKINNVIIAPQLKDIKTLLKFNISSIY